LTNDLGLLFFFDDLKINCWRGRLK